MPSSSYQPELHLLVKGIHGEVEQNLGRLSYLALLASKNLLFVSSSTNINFYRPTLHTKRAIDLSSIAFAITQSKVSVLFAAEILPLTIAKM